MKKIPTIYERDWNGNPGRVLPTLVVDIDWLRVATPTRKYDGSACLVKDGRLFKRRELKRYAERPEGFVLVDDDGREKIVGWVPVSIVDRADTWHRSAFDRLTQHGQASPADGTYELVGPKVNGNREGFTEHVLVPHAEAQSFPIAALPGGVPIAFDALAAWLAARDIEGLVWHGDDGAMAKIKKRDFGLERKPS